MAKRIGKMMLCRRYAAALFEHALEKGEAQKAGAELAGFTDLIESSTELKAVFRNPALPVSAVAATVEALLRKGNASEIVIRFGRILAENRRMQLLPLISGVYNELLAEHNNEITAEVTSAVELGAAHVQNIADGLKKFTGRKVTVKKSVDPALLGGFTVKLGSRLLDGSLAGKLARIEQYLKKAGN